MILERGVEKKKAYQNIFTTDKTALMKGTDFFISIYMKKFQVSNGETKPAKMWCSVKMRGGAF